jgi:L-rhamnonate dehydratase
MKITDVEAIYIRLPEVEERCDSGQDALIVKVHTDEGLVGIGEVDSAPAAVQGMILGPYSHTISSGLRHLLIGEDPFETERLWEKMYQSNIYAGRSGIAIHAMSGIDIALWDLKGKKTGLPIWKLLGGGYRDKIRCYASTLFPETPEETKKLGQRIVDGGFTAVKFGWGPMGQNESSDINLVASARAGVGDQVDLMIDAGMVWDAKTAIQRARSFSDYNIFWLEEPLSPDDYVGYRKLSEATHIRIAAGEEESGRKTYQKLMVEGKIDVVQVDLTRCGGFTEAMKIAWMAADLGLPVANHGFTTYINVAAALHWLNAVPNALIAEYVSQENTTLRDKITQQKIRAFDGYLSIPQGPGLGIDLNETEIERHRVDFPAGSLQTLGVRSRQ